MSGAGVDPTSRYPVGFFDWPTDEQVSWCEVTYTRAGLIRMLLARVQSRPTRSIGRDTKLRKDELARIHLAFERRAHEG